MTDKRHTLKIMGTMVGTYDKWEPGGFSCFKAFDYKPNQLAKSKGVKPCKLLIVNMITGEFTGYDRADKDGKEIFNEQIGLSK